MRRILLFLTIFLLVGVSINAQTDTAGKTATAQTTEIKKRPPIFRAAKEQIMQAQKMLKVTESGKLDDTTRDGLKKYQAEKGLKVTGTLNQLTLEKMGIALTDKQKENASKSSQE
jgi:hypothetical protein